MQLAATAAGSSNSANSSGSASGNAPPAGSNGNGNGGGPKRKHHVDFITSKSAPGELPFKWEDVHYDTKEYLHADFDASLEQEPPSPTAQLHDHARHDPRSSRHPFALHEKNFDVLIVGGGVIGCAIARHLSQFKLNIALLEKANDVSQGASKANSGIVHGGFDEQHGTVKAQLSSKGNRMFPQLEKELNFGFKETGSLVLAFEPSHTAILQRLLKNGNLNGVNNLKIIARDEVLKIEPNVNPDVYQALWCPTAGITSPYEYCIALAENAVQNGVTILLEHEVVDIVRHSTDVADFGQYEGGEAFVEDDPEDLLTSIYKDECGWTPPAPSQGKDASRDSQYFVVRARTMNASIEDHEGGEEVFRGRVVINCAGLYSDKVADMVGARDFDILPRKGEYVILDKTQGHLCKTVLFPVPDPKLGKGILVSPTYHGNLLLGPTSRDLKDKGRTLTNNEVLKMIITSARRTVPGFDISRAITSYTGLRAKSSRMDFIIEESKVHNFVNVAGIDSPGLTSSPAVALRVESILRDMGTLKLEKKESWNPYRRPIIVKKPADWDGTVGDSRGLDYNIVCRCESVTEAEIVDSIRRPLGARTTDMVKRRTRAGMGACQGSFCEPLVTKLLAQNLHVEPGNVPRRGDGTSILPHRKLSWEDKELLKKLERAKL